MWTQWSTDETFLVWKLNERPSGSGKWGRGFLEEPREEAAWEELVDQ